MSEPTKSGKKRKKGDSDDDENAEESTKQTYVPYNTPPHGSIDLVYNTD